MERFVTKLESLDFTPPNTPDDLDQFGSPLRLVAARICGADTKAIQERMKRLVENRKELEGLRDHRKALAGVGLLRPLAPLP